MRLCAVSLGCLIFVAAATAHEPLPEGAKLRLGSSKFRHPHAKIALSTDGKQLISFSGVTKSVRVWDSTTGNLVRELAIDGAIAWAPDGKTFVTSETVPGNKEKPDEYFYRIRDAESGRVICSIPLPSGTRRRTGPIRYLGAGKEIAALTDRGISIWELETGTELLHNTFSNAGYSDFGVSGDGKRIALLAQNARGEVYLWDWESGKEPRRLQTNSKGRFRNVVVSSDGKLLAFLDGLGGPIELVDANDGKVLREFRLPGRRRSFSNAIFTPDDKKLVAPDPSGWAYRQYDEPGGLIVWDVATGKLEKHLTVADRASDVVMSANGKFVAANAIGFPIWDLATGKQLNPLSEIDLAVTDRAYASQGRLLTMSDNNPTRLWDEKSGQLLHVFKKNAWSRVGAISPDGTRVATAASDNSINVWDSESGKLIYRLSGHDDLNGAFGVRFSTDGRKLVSFGADFYLRVTDLSTGKAVREFAIRPAGLKLGELDRPGDPDAFMAVEYARHAVLSVDGSRLCISNGTKYELFDSDSGKVASVLDFPPSFIQNPVFSPDAARLLVWSMGKSKQTPVKGGRTRFEEPKENLLVCWDAKAGRKQWQVMVDDYVASLAFSPDNRLFAVCKNRWDKATPVEFRDSATGELLGQLDRLPSAAQNVIFNGDGKRVVLVMFDATVLVYDLPELNARK